MSTGKISAQKFFAENGLFRKLAIKDEKTNLSRSYKTNTQEYAMECSRCHQQIRQKGNAELECRRCRYSVAPSVKDGEIVWEISPPSTKLKKDRAKEAMEMKAYVLSAEELDMGDPAKALTVKTPVEDSDVEDSDVDDVIVPKVVTKKKKTVDEGVKKKTVDEDVGAKPPSADSMLSFLKKTAPQVSGMRIVEQKRAYTAEQERDIDEPITAVRKPKSSETTQEVESPPVVPTMPAFPTTPLPTMPAFPTVPLPTMPVFPTMPLPAFPSMPLPAIPSMPLPAIPTAQTPCTSTVKEVTMKVVVLAPGQTYFCPVTATLYMGAPA